MEKCIKELEAELEMSKNRYDYAQCKSNKSQRTVLELTHAITDRNSNQDYTINLVNNLGTSLRGYKRQLAEAEEIAAHNLAKYRQAQDKLALAQERADLAERALAKLVAK